MAQPLGKSKNSLKKTVNSVLLNAVVKISRLSGRQPAHFLHVGKTGGTIIKAVLTPSNGKENSSFHGHKSIRKTEDFLIKTHLHSHKLMDVPCGEKVFFCVRNPIDRFISGFYSRKRQGRPMYNFPWSKDEEEAFKCFETPNELALALSSPDDKLKKEAGHAMESIRHVRETYRYWFGSKDYFQDRIEDVLFVLEQEKLGDDFEKLKTVLGLPEELHLPKKGKKGHANPDSLDKSLEPKAVENLKLWYAEDYDFLDLLREHKLI